MKGHPGGRGHTLAMLDRSGLRAPARILDMGAGAGESLAILRARGFDALGIDLEPRGEGVIRADFLRTSFPDGCFDGILSQCAFFVSGDVAGAFREAARLLKPGGLLMLSDVTAVPLENVAESCGFSPVYREDLTPIWKEYFIEALWRGEEIPCLPRGQKYRYQMIIAQRRGSDGPV